MVALFSFAGVVWIGWRLTYQLSWSPSLPASYPPCPTSKMRSSNLCHWEIFMIPVGVPYRA